MRNSRMLVALVAVAASAVAPSLLRAQAAGSKPAAPQATTDASKLTLVYDREVFTYDGRGHRDPFHALSADDEAGTRFEELSLQGIIYSTGPGGSLALLGDGSGRVHRVRVGDVLGDTRVVEIGPLRVVFAVNSFGNVRQEMLELKKSGGGSER